MQRNIATVEKRNKKGTRQTENNEQNNNSPSLSVCCSVAQSCPTLQDPMDCSMPGYPILLHLLELAQTHIH